MLPFAPINQKMTIPSSCCVRACLKAERGCVADQPQHVSPRQMLRACLRIARGAVFVGKAGWRGATKENTPCGSSTEEQRSQTAFPTKTLRAAGLLDWGFVVANVTARSGDVPSAPPRPNPKSPAAALAIFRQALNHRTTRASSGPRAVNFYFDGIEATADRHPAFNRTR